MCLYLKLLHLSLLVFAHISHPLTRSLDNDMILDCYYLFREFCCMVRKIFIYTREEVQKMSPGTLNSHGDGNHAVAEVMDAKEKSQPLPLSSVPEIC